MRFVTFKGYGVASVRSSLSSQTRPRRGDPVLARRRSRDNAQKAKYDFVPSSNAPPFLRQRTCIGAIPPPDYHGLKVLGAYGKAWLIESNYIPPVTSRWLQAGGPGSPEQPGGDPAASKCCLPGPRVIPGHWSNYPLIDSFFARGVGVGVRHRGAAAVLQVTSNASYTPPSATVIPI